MNILLLNQFYYPDSAPTGRYLHDVARMLVSMGHHVSVISSNVSYNGSRLNVREEVVDGVRIFRVNNSVVIGNGVMGKCISYSIYFTLLFKRMFSERPIPDIIFSCTTPPYLGVVANIFSKIFKSKHVHWIMDLYPNALISSGMIKENTLFSNILFLIAKRQWMGGRIIAIGPYMAILLSKIITSRVYWVPLWNRISISRDFTGEYLKRIRAKRGWTSNKLVIGYSGNLGLAHDINTILNVISVLGESGPKWVFSGSGIGFSEIRKFINKFPKLPVEILSYVPEDQLVEHISAHDIHIVSIAKKWEGVVIPSKLQTIMAVGRPILAIVPKESEIAHWIRIANAGWVAEPGDISTILNALHDASDAKMRTIYGNNAQLAANRWFNPTRNIRLVSQLIIKYSVAEGPRLGIGSI
jgi:colanic acid biosynthesis glycosyl transferase WcaI